MDYFERKQDRRKFLIDSLKIIGASAAGATLAAATFGCSKSSGRNIELSSTYIGRSIDTDNARITLDQWVEEYYQLTEKYDSGIVNHYYLDNDGMILGMYINEEASSDESSGIGFKDKGWEKRAELKQPSIDNYLSKIIKEKDAELNNKMKGKY